ncbi:MAG: hypothetical protein WA862_06755 [Solirubrobacterales bacterium]
MRRLRLIGPTPIAVCLGIGLLLLALCGGAGAEVVQRGHLRVAFDGKLTPRALPRSTSIPVNVSMGGQISTTGGGAAPQLQRITIAINRYGRVSPGSLPSCRIDEIQPATTEGALEACGRSLVGEGSFSANVLLPEQAPFPSRGKVYAFNGTYNGKRAILAHVYGTQPAPTSYTLPFLIRETKGTYGTVLSASLPAVTSQWGYVTGLSLNLRGTAHNGGFLRASCPAPKGFTVATFPLARTTFAFAGGKALSATLTRSCKVR